MLGGYSLWNILVSLGHLGGQWTVNLPCKLLQVIYQCVLDFVLDGALHQWFPIRKDRLILELFGNQLVVNFVVAAAVVVVVVVSIRFEDFWNPSFEGLSFEDEGGRYCSVF